MTRYEYDGQRAAARNQLVLQFQAAKTWHANIEDQATESVTFLVLQKLVGRGKYLMLYIDRLKQCLHGDSDCWIVVNDEHGLRAV